MAESASHIAFAVTHPLTADRLLGGQLSHLRSRGWRVSLVCSPGPILDRLREREGVTTIPIPMEREIAPLADLCSLVQVRSSIRRLRPDLVVAGTPKAGLLGMLGARSLGTPGRVYHVRGLRLETTRGFKRQLLRLTERLAAASANAVLANSESLRLECIEAGVAPAGKIRVPGAGSAVGIDAEALRAEAGTGAEQEALRSDLGISPGAAVIGYVGRFVRDKGIVELEAAFERLRAAVPRARLLMLGEFEDGDPVPPAVRRRLEADPRVVMPGFVDAPARYLPLLDVLAFPSWREGMPNAPLEAAAFGIPTVGFRATGTVDAVVDGTTGLLVPTGDAAALAAALQRVLEDRELRSRLGDAARDRTIRLFSQARVHEAWEAEYLRVLEKGTATAVEVCGSSPSGTRSMRGP